MHGIVYHTTANCEYHRAITFSSALARGLNLIDSPWCQRGHRARHVIKPRENVSCQAGHDLSQAERPFGSRLLTNRGLCCGKDIASTEN